MAGGLSMLKPCGAAADGAVLARTCTAATLWQAAADQCVATVVEVAKCFDLRGCGCVMNSTQSKRNIGGIDTSIGKYIMARLYRRYLATCSPITPVSTATVKEMTDGSDELIPFAGCVRSRKLVIGIPASRKYIMILAKQEIM